MDDFVLLVDTNMIVRAVEPPWLWKLGELTREERVTVMITRSVLRELDRHVKNDSRPPAFQSRARDRRQAIVHHVVKHAAQALGSGVVGLVYDGVGTDGDQGDDAILASLAAMRASGMRVGLLTDDATLALTARGDGVPVWLPERTQMSTFEHRTTNEQLRLLRADLDAVRARLEAHSEGTTSLSLSFEGDSTRHTHRWTPTPELSPEEVESMAAALLKAAGETADITAARSAQQTAAAAAETRRRKNDDALTDKGLRILLRNGGSSSARSVQLSLAIPPAVTFHIRTRGHGFYQEELSYSYSHDRDVMVLRYEMIHRAAVEVLPFSWIHWPREQRVTIPFTLSAENADTVTGELIIDIEEVAAEQLTGESNGVP
jgi:rRNA-processing protein FCF1